MMVEAESTPATWGLVRGGRTAPTEEVVATGLEAAKPFIKVLCDAQVALAAKLPKETYDFPVFKDYEDDVYAAVEEKAADELSRIEQIAAKLERQEAESELKARIKAELAETFPEREAEISGAFKAVMKKKIVRKRVLDEGVRIDGRGPRDIRSLSAEVGIIPRVHGSALFQRGETQILGVSTLNMLDMEQKLDTLSPENTRRTCTTTTCRRTPPVKPAVLVPRSVARLVTVTSPSGPSFRCCRPARSSPTPSARFPRLLALMVRPRWGRFAPPPSPCSMPVCRCAPRSLESPWAHERD